MLISGPGSSGFAVPPQKWMVDDEFQDWEATSLYTVFADAWPDR
jgi:hypothetical protein